MTRLKGTAAAVMNQLSKKDAKKAGRNKAEAKTKDQGEGLGSDDPAPLATTT